MRSSRTPFAYDWIAAAAAVSTDMLYRMDWRLATTVATRSWRSGWVGPGPVAGVSSPG